MEVLSYSLDAASQCNAIVNIISRLTFCGWFLWYIPPRQYKSLSLQKAVCVKTDASMIGHGLELVVN